MKQRNIFDWTDFLTFFDHQDLYDEIKGVGRYIIEYPNTTALTIDINSTNNTVRVTMSDVQKKTPLLNMLYTEVSSVICNKTMVLLHREDLFKPAVSITFKPHLKITLRPTKDF